MGSAPTEPSHTPQCEDLPPPLYRPPSPAPSYRTLDIRIRESLSRPRVGITGRILNAIVPRGRGRDARGSATTDQVAASTATDNHPPPCRDATVTSTETKVASVPVNAPVAAEKANEAAKDATCPKVAYSAPLGSKTTLDGRPVVKKRKPLKPAKTVPVYTEAGIKAFEPVGLKARCAIRQNNAELLSLLLNEKCNWSTPLPDGSRLLHAAAELGRTSMLKDLLEHKADVVVEDINGATPLHLGIRNGHTAVVDALLAAEESWRGTPRSSLELAAGRGDEKMVDALLQFIVPGLDYNRYTAGCGLHVINALQNAADKGHHRIATTLYGVLSQSSDPYMLNIHDGLIWPAINHNWPDILERVISRLTRENSLHRVTSRPQFLISAASDDLTEIATQLLRAGISPNANNGYRGRGQFALHHAANMGEVKAVALLLEWGADPNLLNGNGMNALNSAVSGGAPMEIVRMFLARGVDIYVKDDHGQSPFEVAQLEFSGRRPILDLMIEYGYVVEADEQRQRFSQRLPRAFRWEHLSPGKIS